MALLRLTLCTSTPSCIRDTTACPLGGGGQAWAVAEARQAAQLPHLPQQAGGQWEHSPAPCPVSPPAPSLAGVPIPEPPSHHTVHPPSPNGVWHCTEETSAHGAVLPQALAPLAPKVLSLGSMCVQPLRAPSHPHPPQPRPASGSSHSLGTAPHMPLNPARLQAGGMCPPKQLLLQPYLLLLSARGRSTPGPGRALRAQGALLSPRRSLGGVHPSREKLQCHAWVTGITNHGGKSPGRALCHTRVSS